jgi:hypothetical protein
LSLDSYDDNLLNSVTYPAVSDTSSLPDLWEVRRVPLYLFPIYLSIAEYLVRQFLIAEPAEVVMETFPTRPRREAAISATDDLRTGLAIVAERPVSSKSAARDISAAVGSAVEAALGSVAPYSSHGATFTGEAEFEHVDAAGARTRAHCASPMAAGKADDCGEGSGAAAGSVVSAGMKERTATAGGFPSRLLQSAVGILFGRDDPLYATSDTQRTRYPSAADASIESQPAALS